MRRWVGLWVGLFTCAAFFSSGCGGSTGGGSDAQVRVVLGSPDAPQANVLVDGKSVAGNLGYANATAYLSVKPGSRHIQVVPVSGGSAIFDQSISFTSSTNQTLLLTGAASGIQPVMLKDGGTTSVSGSGYVRVVNASATMGPADAYIVAAGGGINGVLPVKASMAFDQDTGYQVFAAGNYQVFMTTPGSSNAMLNTGSISLAAAQNQTVVVLDGASSGFMFALLTDQ